MRADDYIHLFARLEGQMIEYNATLLIYGCFSDVDAHGFIIRFAWRVAGIPELYNCREDFRGLTGIRRVFLRLLLCCWGLLRLESILVRSRCGRMGRLLGCSSLAGVAVAFSIQRAATFGSTTAQDILRVIIGFPGLARRWSKKNKAGPSFRMARLGCFTS
jgi:hypothetical protein